MWEHWRMSQRLNHPAMLARPLEPGLSATVQAYAAHWQTLPDLWRAAVEEIRSLVREWEDETPSWFFGLPEEIKTVYTTNGHR